MKTYAPICYLLLLSFIATAQVPQAFSYQGLARDTDSNPLQNQNIGLQISIREGAVNGNARYVESHATTTNNFGLFNIQVGKGTVLDGSMESIEWGANSHFLEVAVDYTGGTNYQLLGTTELLSVPYALHAENGSKWLEIEPDSTIGYPNLVNIGNLNQTNEFFDFELNIRGYENTVFSGISIKNENTEGRSIVLLGRGLSAKYLYMSYHNQDWGIDLPPSNTLFSANQANIFTGAENGLNIIASDGNIRMAAGGSTSDNSQFVLTEQGNVYVSRANSGIIMKSSDGNCWLYRPNTSGALQGTAVTCPD